MDYQETLDYLFHRLPVFSRDGDSAIKNDLTNTLALCQLLGNPQERFKSIHIAGTNGKGSSSHTIAAILQKSGYKTGLYTSPHLIDFRERIRCNGEMIPSDKVIAFVEKYRQEIERIQPSFFEVTVALAFDYFAEQHVDIAVIETGLGGRLDATNVIKPILSLITNIGFDHVSLLGNTLEKIAREKAGIIKEHTPVIIGEFQPEVSEVFQEIARVRHAPLRFASSECDVTFVEMTAEGQKFEVSFSGEGGDSDLNGLLTLDLRGSYQKMNLPGILTAVSDLRRLGFHLPAEAVREALANVQVLTGLQGRWQRISDLPRIYCDTGHNEQGWKVVLSNISSTPHRRLHMVLGVMADKDLASMLRLLPDHADYYFCQVDFPRALPANEFKAKAAQFGLSGQNFPNVREAFIAAKRFAEPEDLIFVGGSSFVVGDFLAEFTPTQSILP